MPLSRALKRRILQNPFSWYLRNDFRVDRNAYECLIDDMHRLVGEIREDRDLDKEVLQAIWADIRVAEGAAARMREWGRPEELVFEVENMAIELDGLLIEILAVRPGSEDWGWWLDPDGRPGETLPLPGMDGAEPER